MRRGRGDYSGGYDRFQSSRSSSGGAAIPPPPSVQASAVIPSRKNNRGFATLNSIHEMASSVTGSYAEVHRRRNRTQDEYFEEDDEPTPYQPAPGSPGFDDAKKADDSDEEDPLEAFMAGIEKEVKKQTEPASSATKKGIRDDIEAEDDEETYYRYVAENPNFGQDEDSEDDGIEYDEDGNPIAPKKSKYIDPLPPIDHSKIEYDPFEKNFYVEHEDIEKLTADQVEQLRRTLCTKVSGADIPKPVSSFGHLGLPEPLMRAIRKSEFTQPTPIQAQGIPVALSGRDLIGIAKTGSGKTAAYLWPMLVHIADQPALLKGDGPIGLILCPTRELALQIYTEAKKFGKVFNLRVACCYGGGSKWEQSKDLEAGAEVVVATPGRMIDMIKIKATNLERVTYLVLDEADRMFDMGFEAQVKSICAHVRPDRQSLLFSATFRKKVEKLARSALNDPIRVIQGDVGEANQDVTQHVLVMNLGGAKWHWLTSHIVEFCSRGSILIFVTKKLNAEELHSNLKLQQFDALLLHGDMDQLERNKVIQAFRKKECDILVATDVAARGLDIPHIKTVINYDVARDVDTHTHRIGRTGRAGEKGDAYTLVTEKDKEFAGHIVRSVESVGQTVPPELMELAMKSAWFRKSRFKQGKGKNAANVGTCRGLGYKEDKSSSSNPAISGSYGTPPPSQSYQSLMSSFKPASVSPAEVEQSASSGPASNRLNAVRSAFKQQYMSQFKKSEESPTPLYVPPSDLMPPPPPAPVSESSSDSSPATKKRKSRWD